MARLSVEDWVQGALDVLAEEGFAAVAVEPLAKRLGVTKGSFYWHFKDRNALIAAVLEEWERVETESVIQWLEKYPTGQERVTRLLRRALDDRASSDHYLALAAAGHPLVEEALQRVSARRLGYLQECYAQMGVKHPKERAHVAYATYIGTLHLSRGLVKFPKGYAEALLQTLA